MIQGTIRSNSSNKLIISISYNNNNTGSILIEELNRKTNKIKMLIIADLINNRHRILITIILAGKHSMWAITRNRSNNKNGLSVQEEAIKMVLIK